MSDDAETAAEPNRPAISRPARRARQSWPWLVGIAITTGMALVGVQCFGWGSSKPSWDLVAILALANLASYIWIRTGSHWTLGRQIGAVLAMVAVQSVFWSLVRMDGFAGDGRVIFKPRWERTTEQRWREFAEQNATASEVVEFPPNAQEDSPAFRGADRSGEFQCAELDTDWKSHPPRLLWRHPVGSGWSSFAVVGPYCVTQEQRGATESVVCYEVATGREVWLNGDMARFEEPTSGAGPRATPTIDHGRVYTFGATGILNCLDGRNGFVVWQRRMSDIATDGPPPPLFGYASSPLVDAGKVIVAGGAAGSLVAFSADHGNLLWRSDPRPPGYSSPQLVRSTHGNQVLLLDGVGLYGHDVETGSVLWNVEWGDGSDEFVNVGQPIIVRTADDESGYSALISSGYGRGTALIRVERGPDSRWQARVVWRTKSLKSKFSSVVVRDNCAYGLDEGILACISLSDGSRLWKRGRYGHGQLIGVNNLLMVQAEDGRVVLVRADAEQATEIAALSALSDRTWNHPVVAAGRLLVRNDREAACYELPSRSADAD